MTQQTTTDRAGSGWLVSVVRALLVGAGVALMAGGCSTYRVEYRHVPEYKAKATPGGIPEKVVLDDGTVLINVIGDKSRKSALQATAANDAKPFQIREEYGDGSVVLRAVLPEHVVDNALVCIQRGEFELLWDQMLSERTKLAYSERGLGAQDFGAFLTKHRDDLIYTLRRMMLEFPRDGVYVEKIGNGIIEARLSNVIARQHNFKFSRVQIVNEGLGMKLLLIL